MNDLESEVPYPVLSFSLTKELVEKDPIGISPFYYPRSI
jgi:hypothetical protein